VNEGKGESLDFRKGDRPAGSERVVH
jgi:hypothetical protein